MHLKRNCFSWSFLAVASLALGIGCSKGVDPAIVELRKSILLNSEPAKSITLTEAKEALADENDVVLIGKIGTGQLDPFEKRKAAFVLSEAPEDHGDAGHDAGDCPFCKRRMEEAPIAQIEFIDEKGQVLPYSVPDLLGVKNGQIVSIVGRGRYDKETDTLQIAGRSLYIKR